MQPHQGVVDNVPKVEVETNSREPLQSPVVVINYLDLPNPSTSSPPSDHGTCLYFLRRGSILDAY